MRGCWCALSLLVDQDGEDLRSIIAVDTVSRHRPQSFDDFIFNRASERP